MCGATMTPNVRNESSVFRERMAGRSAATETAASSSETGRKR